jgi:hypothetical protein
MYRLPAVVRETRDGGAGGPRYAMVDGSRLAVAVVCRTKVVRKVER